MAATMTTAAHNHVLPKLHAAADLNIPIVAISLGAGADIPPDGVGGRNHRVTALQCPWRTSVADYREDLFEVFRAIADSRPLKLVK